MSQKASKRAAISFIDKYGILLVYPVKNSLTLPSLWKCFYPRMRMKWDWSYTGSDKVVELWHLRAELSLSRKVVYTKWSGGRATFFSFELFTAMLSLTSPHAHQALSDDAKTVYAALEDDSPQATKALRGECGLTGKPFEGRFQKALRELWSKLLIVGYGEVDEGGFPSLAVGATKHLFEDLWERSLTMTSQEREKVITAYIPPQSPFFKQYQRFLAKNTLPC